MYVIKRNGSKEPIRIEKIQASLSKMCEGLNVDPVSVAIKVIGGLYDGATTRQIDELTIDTLIWKVNDEPDHSFAGANVLMEIIKKEVANQEIASFSQSIQFGVTNGLISPEVGEFVKKNARKLNAAINVQNDKKFEYFGLKTVYDRYLLKHPTSRKVFETPQYWLMRVAAGIFTGSVKDTIEFYNTLSSHEYMTSTPTLFNSATNHTQMSSCYLLPPPTDDVEGIYKTLSDVAKLSKWAGGIGLDYSLPRGEGSLIKGTNGLSNGIIPFLHTLDSSVLAINQCFHPSTQVYTRDGIKNISDIVANKDMVLGISGEYRQVLETMTYEQSDPMLEIKLRHQILPTVVTDAHPFFGIRVNIKHETEAAVVSKLRTGAYTADWIESKELRVGDYVGVKVPTQIRTVEDFTDDDAYVYGLMLGDGHLTGYESGISFHLANNQESHDRVLAYLAKNDVHYWRVDFTDKQYFQIRWSNSSLPKLCKLELLYDGDHNKRIHPSLFHLPPAQTWQMIKGLIDSDGHIHDEKEITFYNSSYPLVEGVRYQLLRLGVMTSGNWVDRNTYNYSTPNLGHKQMSGTVRIPLVEPLANMYDLVPVSKKHYVTYDGYLFTRVKTTKPVEYTGKVHDMIVEGDESYTIVNALVHNGGKRKGAACVYLETFHSDLPDFLELRDNTGDPHRRTHNLNLANWIPDVFMRRVRDQGDWTLLSTVDPDVAALLSLHGDEYGVAYEALERKYEAMDVKPKWYKKVTAQSIWFRMMRTLCETGNGWINFKDTANRMSNQVTSTNGKVIRSSNLCIAPDTFIGCKLNGTHALVTIEELTKRFKSGEYEVEVLSLNETTNEYEWKIPVNVGITNEDAELLEIELPDGNKIKCTEDHLLLTARGWCKAGDLVESDELVTCADITSF